MDSTTRLIAIVAFLSVVIGAPAFALDVPETAMKGDAGEAMHDYMQRLSAFGFHGVALVARGGDVVFHQAYGVRDPRDGSPNTTATLFSTGSVTKQFTAAAIMKLESEGKLSVDDTIDQYFDDVPDDKSGITLHHMLTHTAGLHPSYGPDRESVTRDDFVRLVLEQPLIIPVGDIYQYSNAGFSLLAIVVEKITGMPYEEYLRENMYLPNGMDHTGLTSLDVSDDEVARAHNKTRAYPSPADRPPDAWHLYGNGGQLSTTADMYRWYRALKENRLFPREYKNKMFTRYAAEDPEGNCHYGYGWSICSTRRGGDVAWHNGGSMGLWSCAIYQYIDDDAVFIVFANTTMDGQSPVDHIAVDLSRILFGESIEMPPDLSSAPPAATNSAGFAGTYELSAGASLIVSADGNAITIAPVGQDAMMTLFPSRMNPMLPKYNGKTEEMLEALRAGDYERAGANVEMEPTATVTAARWLRDWWESHDNPELLESFNVIGTKFGEGAETYVQLTFTGETVDYCFHWMMGRCQGIEPAAPPVRVLRATAPTRFTTFSLGGGIVEADFSRRGFVILRVGGESMEGTLRRPRGTTDG